MLAPSDFSFAIYYPLNLNHSLKFHRALKRVEFKMYPSFACLFCSMLSFLSR